jgi:hypothetical protein
MKFTTNNRTSINFNVSYDNKTIEEVVTTSLVYKFKITNWKKHTEYIIPKFRSACFVMRTVTPLLKVDTLKSVYFAYFHSFMSHGVIFWRNSTDSKRVFIIQKKIIRIMACVKEEYLAENYLRNLICSPLRVNACSHYCLSLWTTHT